MIPGVANQPVGVPTPERIRRCNAALEKRAVEFFLLGCKPADGNLGFPVEQPPAEKAFFMVADVHGIAIVDNAGQPGDVAGIDPGVAGNQPVFFICFEYDRGHN